MTLLSSFMYAFIDPALIVAAPNYTTSSDQALFWAVATVAILVSLCIGIILYVITAIFFMKLFAKANVPAWKAWVPFVNTWKFFELGGYHGALSLLLYSSVIPFLGWISGAFGVVLFCMAAYQIGLKNGKSGSWVVLFIFLEIVWAGILGLGSSTWNDSLGKPALGLERPPSWPPAGGQQPQGYYPPQ